jgi:hypothetical protein
MRINYSLTLPVALAFVGIAVGQERIGQDRYERDANIVGTWYLSGDRNQPCYVEPRGRDERLVFTNERNEAAYGTVEGRRVRVPSWDDPNVGGLFGQVREDVILWNNGTYWTRRPIF